MTLDRRTLCLAAMAALCNVPLARAADYPSRAITIVVPTPAGGASDSTNVAKAPMICQDVFERLYIYSNGDVALCCADDNGFFRLGNAIEDDPIAIYNNTIFTNIRYMMN